MIWTLVKKEFNSLICSAYFFFFALIYLSACGLMLWILPGNFNIIDNGYATLNRFFDLSPTLLLILVPALTMRSISEEKLTKTITLLYSRPINLTTLYISKVVSIFTAVAITIIPTIIYLYTIHSTSVPVGNIDIASTIIGYIALFFVVGVFVSVGVFASAISKHQIISFIAAIIINFSLFYGFNLVSDLTTQATFVSFLKSLSLATHYQQLQRGVIELNNTIIFFNYLFLFAWLTSIILQRGKKHLHKHILISALILVVFNIVVLIAPNQRIDFTSDKRYTLNDYSINVLNNIGEGEIKVNIYLDGNINYSFRELTNSTKELLTDFNKYTKGNIDFQFINPSDLPLKTDELPYYMANQGMPPITLNEKDRDGKISQQLIYPYAQLIHDNDTLQIQLLKNILGNTAIENFEASTNNLEFEFVDAIKLLTNRDEIDIAFLEGHGELSRADLYDVEDALAKYYFINRGQIENDPSVLLNFRALIIAGPQEKFSEADKYAIDQYLMDGGRLLWFIDGAKVSHEQLQTEGQSPSMKNETNLDDLLLTYGIRINSDLLEDKQASEIVVTSETNSPPTLIPWYFSPLLIPSLDNSVTKNIAYVKAPFSSSLSLLSNSAKLSPEVLLTTSANTHIMQVPEMVTFDINKSELNDQYFNHSYIPTAIALSGNFVSAFQNRSIPEGILTDNHTRKDISNTTKIIVVSSSQLIKNEVLPHNNQVLPIGFDKVSGIQYGNRDFVINAVNWLTSDNEWQSIKNKQITQRLLNKQLVYQNRTYYASLNTSIPIIFIGLIVGLTMLYRHRKYSK